jgi:hypothetical protein
VTSPPQTAYQTATITEVNLASGGADMGVKGGVQMTVDFNPHSLSLRYSVGPKNTGQKAQASGAQINKAPAQWVGERTSLSMQLIFDSTATGQSVQLKTAQLVSLTRPSAATPGTASTTSAKVVQFSWGSFVFIGMLSSMSQTIDYFSAAGVPLRATVDISLEQVDPPASRTSAASSDAPPTSFGAGVSIAGGAPASVPAGASQQAAAGVSGSVGTTPLTLSAAGDTVQSIAAQAGASVSWKVLAAANNIDNPRILPPGTVLDLSATATAAGAAAPAAATVQTS